MTIAELIASLARFPLDRIVNLNDTEWGLLDIRSVYENRHGDVVLSPDKELT